MVAWPITEALHHSKVWRDDVTDPDEVSVSVLMPTPQGLITGNLEMI
jgi:hypothetical protein